MGWSSGGGPGNLQWDAHKDIEENHRRMAGRTDRPVAGLLRDGGLRLKGQNEQGGDGQGAQTDRLPVRQDGGEGRRVRLDVARGLLLGDQLDADPQQERAADQLQVRDLEQQIDDQDEDDLPECQDRQCT